MIDDEAIAVELSHEAVETLEHVMHGCTKAKDLGQVGSYTSET